MNHLRCYWNHCTACYHFLLQKSKFKDASVCYVIFDMLQFNDDNLMSKPIVERRSILEKNVKEIKNHIILSEMTKITVSCTKFYFTVF